MQACSSKYCKDIRKHLYTEKLGWPPCPSNFYLISHCPPIKLFNIHARKKMKVNDVELDFTNGCILVNLSYSLSPIFLQAFH